MATVNIESVQKYYEEHKILDEINLNIEKGEFVALVGPSGSGKSTLLRLVAGLDTVCEGKILINDKCVNQIHPSKRNMAMVFQSYALYPHMTVFANMAYGLKMRGMKPKDIEARVHEVSELLQIKPYLNRKPTALSGGQRQRVAMGRAIVRDPAVFLFDEPLSNLDTKLRAEMRHEIKKLHQKLNTTCLYVTHDQTEAMTLADRIVVLNHGKIEQQGSPQNLYQKPETMFVGSFIGHYPMNFIPATMNKSNLLISSPSGLCISKPLLDNTNQASEDVIIGIRPEHMYFASVSGEATIECKIEFIDDMGADKLIQLRCLNSQIPIAVRTLDEQVSGKTQHVAIDWEKATLFCNKTTKRIGTWNE